MDIIQNSGDILNIVIAVSIALLVLFICWGLFYVVMTVRNFYKISKETREGFSKVSEILSRAKEQVENGTFYLSLAKEGIEKGVNILREKIDGRKQKNTSKKNSTSAKKSTTKTSTKGRTGTTKKNSSKK